MAALDQDKDDDRAAPEEELGTSALDGVPRLPSFSKERAVPSVADASVQTTRSFPADKQSGATAEVTTQNARTNNGKVHRRIRPREKLLAPTECRGAEVM